MIGFICKKIIINIIINIIDSDYPVLGCRILQICADLAKRTHSILAG